MVGNLGFHLLQMNRILSAKFRLAPSSGTSLQSRDAFLLKACQPIINDDLAATKYLGDFERRTFFTFQEYHLATKAKCMIFALAITVFKSRALFIGQFDCSC